MAATFPRHARSAPPAARRARFLPAHPGGLLRRARRQEGQPVAPDLRLRPRRHHRLQRRKSVSRDVERGANRSAQGHVLQPGPLERLLEHPAVRIRDATARAAGRHDLRLAAPRAGMAPRGAHASDRLSRASRKLHVEFSRPSQSRSALLRLAGATGDLWLQSVFPARPRTPRHARAEPAVPGRTVAGIVVRRRGLRLACTVAPPRSLCVRRECQRHRLYRHVLPGRRRVGLPLRLLVRAGGPHGRHRCTRVPAWG